MFPGDDRPARQTPRSATNAGPAPGTDDDCLDPRMHRGGRALQRRGSCARMGIEPVWTVQRAGRPLGVHDGGRWRWTLTRAAGRRSGARVGLELHLTRRPRPVPGDLGRRHAQRSVDGRWSRSVLGIEQRWTMLRPTRPRRMPRGGRGRIPHRGTAGGRDRPMLGRRRDVHGNGHRMGAEHRPDRARSVPIGVRRFLPQRRAAVRRIRARLGKQRAGAMQPTGRSWLSHRDPDHLLPHCCAGFGGLGAVLGLQRIRSMQRADRPSALLQGGRGLAPLGGDRV